MAENCFPSRRFMLLFDGFSGDLPPHRQGRVFSRVALAPRVIDMNFDSGQTTFLSRREYFMPNCGALPDERGELPEQVQQRSDVRTQETKYH